MITLLFDSHVHFYRCYDLSLLLHSAVSHAKNMMPDAVPLLGLVLTDGEVSWGELQAWAKYGTSIVGEGGKWLLSATEVGQILQAQSSNGHLVLLMAGRQLVTREGLELLVLGATEVLSDRSASLSWHLDNNAQSLRILPWGVGKWLGSRGAEVDRIINDRANEIVLGDNAGRPGLWAWIPQFKKARALKIPVWPGTDPLPLNGAEKKVGSNYVVLSVHQIADLVRNGNQLRDAAVNGVQHRSSVGLIDFVKSQVALRIKRN